MSSWSMDPRPDGTYTIGWIDHASILSRRGYRTHGEHIVYVSTGRWSDRHAGCPIYSVHKPMPSHLRDPNWHRNAKVI